MSVKQDNHMAKKSQTRQSRSERRPGKLIAWKNKKGEWEGDMVVAELYGNKGDKLYLKAYKARTENEI